MVYLDTSVLLAFTLTKRMEPARFRAASKLFELIDQGAIKTEPDWEAGSELAREALLAILSSRLLYIPIPRREDKMLRARLFSALRDPTDLPHAIAAHTVGCTAIVAYDDHFRAITDILPYKTPDEVIAELEAS